MISTRIGLAVEAPILHSESHVHAYIEGQQDAALRGRRDSKAPENQLN